ncbi:uncharacterized protein LOC143288228 [Babylonia areolata]|uniref:uncharacterized protein LOC143288228 n=1 Tax=Babylonia areolata TaxID=304850 RepID=UPI003FD5D83E
MNCGGGHPSSSKDCPTWKKEKEIQKVKTEKKISFFEARKQVEAALPKASYASVVRTRKVDVAIQTTSTGTQTDDLPTLVEPLALGGGAVSTPSHPVWRSSGAAGRERKASGGGTVSASRPPPPPGPPRPASSLPAPRAGGSAQKPPRTSKTQGGEGCGLGGVGKSRGGGYSGLVGIGPNFKL